MTYNKYGRKMWQSRDEFMTWLRKANNSPKTRLLLDSGNAIMVEAGCFEDCNLMFNFPTIDWCIAEYEHHWNEYVKKGHRQLFLIQFKKLDAKVDSDEFVESLIGFTMDKDCEVEVAHGRNDRCIVHDTNNTENFEKILKSVKMYRYIFDFYGQEEFKYLDTEKKHLPSNKSIMLQGLFIVLSCITVATLICLAIAKLCGV